MTDNAHYVDPDLPPAVLTTYAPPCAECERLRADLAAIGIFLCIVTRRGGYLGERS